MNVPVVANVVAARETTVTSALGKYILYSINWSGCEC